MSDGQGGRRRRKRAFTERTEQWFEVGDEMGETPIEGDYEPEPPRLDLRAVRERARALPGQLRTLARSRGWPDRLRALPSHLVARPRVTGGVALGLVFLLWLLV